MGNVFWLASNAQIAMSNVSWQGKSEMWQGMGIRPEQSPGGSVGTYTYGFQILANLEHSIKTKKFLQCVQGDIRSMCVSGIP